MGLVLGNGYFLAQQPQLQCWRAVVRGHLFCPLYSMPMKWVCRAVMVAVVSAGFHLTHLLHWNK